MAITVLALYANETRAEIATQALRSNGFRRVKPAVISAENQDNLNEALAKRGVTAEAGKPYAERVAAGDVLVAIKVGYDFGMTVAAILYSNEGTAVKQFANT